MIRGEVKALMEAEQDSIKEHLEEKEAEILMKIEELRNENLALRVRMEKHEAEMTKELTSVSTRDLPYMMLCAYQDSWTTASATVTYDSLVSSYNNHDHPNGGDGKLDLGSGIYTCLTAG